MRFRSVCSGIEAASAAWLPLGWECVSVAEIDPFASAVLAHRYPETPNLGDFTRIEAEPGSADVLVGGTPCQSFSVAGLRGGLADARGNLALEFLRLAGRTRPRWVVWENVPGVLSSTSHDAPDRSPPDIDLDGDDGPADGEEVVVADAYESDETHAFACFLAGLQILGYGVSYRILDAQYFGLAQQRQRVFVVGCLGSWRGATAVLFEHEALSGNPRPGRAAWEDDPEDATGCPPIPIHNIHYTDRGTTRDGSGLGDPGDPAYTIETRNRNAVAFQERGRMGGRSLEWSHDRAYSLNAPAGGGRRHENNVAFNVIGCGQQGRNHAYQTEVSGCLQHKGLAATGNEAGTLVAYGFAIRGREGDQEIELGSEVANALRPSPGSAYSSGVVTGWAVRRLTPRECERLQGFPDDWTLVPYRGKPAADGPRYRAIGNSMAVPVMAWIGRRIQMVEEVRP